MVETASCHIVGRSALEDPTEGHILVVVADTVVVVGNFGIAEVEVDTLPDNFAGAAADCSTELRSCCPIESLSKDGR